MIREYVRVVREVVKMMSSPLDTILIVMNYEANKLIDRCTGMKSMNSHEVSRLMSKLVAARSANNVDLMSDIIDECIDIIQESQDGR